jgi:hypothetical protein
MKDTEMYCEGMFNFISRWHMDSGGMFKFISRWHMDSGGMFKFISRWQMCSSVLGHCVEKTDI